MNGETNEKKLMLQTLNRSGANVQPSKESTSETKQFNSPRSWASMALRAQHAGSGRSRNGMASPTARLMGRPQMQTRRGSSWLVKPCLGSSSKKILPILIFPMAISSPQAVTV
jgi:hypothetical protein